MSHPFLRTLWTRAGLWVLLLACVACSSTSRPKPAQPPAIANPAQVTSLWSFDLGKINSNLVPAFTANGRVVLASDQSELITLQLSDGKVLERVALNLPLSAGVGTDGNRHAIVTRDNVLVAVEHGREIWRKTLSAQVYTSPLVAGQRVFVLLADRTLQAFDGASGRLLWTQARTGDPLVLKQSGTLMPYGNTLVAGLSGRLAGFDPTTGRILWEAPLATPRGLNDLERLVDVVGLTFRSDPFLCARAYLAQVGCVNVNRGQVVWSRTSQGEQGLSGHDNRLVGTEANGLVVSWQRDTGDRLWESDALKYRHLSAPTVTDRHIWTVDDEGMLYLLNLQNGQLMHRSSIDGSPLAAPPLQRQGVVLLVTRKGTVRALTSP
jgi:outer membrane protein assembly factor BamB